MPLEILSIQGLTELESECLLSYETFQNLIKLCNRFANAVPKCAIENILDDNIKY